MANVDFEEGLLELERRIAELARFPGDAQKAAEQERLRRELRQARDRVFANLTPWQKTQLARHSLRPYMLDFVQALFVDFTELHGDRRFGDDPALVCGLALFD